MSRRKTHPPDAPPTPSTQSPLRRESFAVLTTARGARLLGFGAQRRRVLRLIDTQLSAPRQREPRDRPPPLLIDRRARHILRLHFGDERLNVVAHEKQLVRVVLVGGVHRELRRRQRKNQPASSCID